MNHVSRLFDLTFPVHRLSPTYRTLLRAAALLHDVGRSQNGRRHHIRGQSMILEDKTLPLNPAQRRLVAFLARYHRKKIPRKSRVCRDVPDYPPSRVFTLLALIKAADALDSRKCPPMALTLRRVGKTIQVDCFLANNPRSTIHAISGKRKFKLIERTLGLYVELKFRRSR